MKFPFTAVTVETNITSQIKITDTNVLITDVLANPLSLSLPTPSVTIFINPLNSPIPTPSTISQPTPTPISSSLPTSDIQPPQVTITSPAENSLVNRRSQFTIGVIASDNVAVAKVEFRVNNKLTCTDNQNLGYTCDWKVPAKPNETYILEAKAYDAAANTGVHAISVTSSGN